MLKNEVEARDNFIITLKQKLKQAEIERDDLKLKFEKFQSSSKSLIELIASQTNNKHGLGYLSSEGDSESLSLNCPSDRVQPSGGYNVVPHPITGNFMPPKPDLVFNTAPLVVESDHSAFNVQLSPAKPAQAISHATRSMAPIIEDWPVEASILKTTYNSTSSKTNGSRRMNRKTCFVCKGVDHLIKNYNFHAKLKTQPTPKNFAHMGYDKQYASSTKKYPQNHIAPAAVLTKSKPVYVTATRSGNPQHALKDKGVIDSGCSWHMTGNMSYLFDFQELNGGYVAFRGYLKGGKISGKGKIKIDFKLPDENQVLLRVPRENNMYNVNLKDTVPSGDLTCLFAKATIDESNLWHRRLGYFCEIKGIKREFSVPKTPQQNGIAKRKNRTLIEAARTMLADSLLPILFWAEAVNTACTGLTWLFDIDSLTRTMNYQLVIVGNQTNPSAGFQEEFDARKTREEADQQYMIFPVWSTGLTNPQNKEEDYSLCGNNSHDGYDCQQQFLFVHEQELSYNQNYDEIKEPSQEFDFHQLIKECSTEVSEKQSMEDTMLELVKICQEKEFLCIHDDIDDLIESALNSKLLLINSQRLDKKEQKVKNVVEQSTERGNHSIQSLQNFKVVHKSSISFNTSQISSIHAIAPVLSTKEPEHLLSMGYEHLSITPETESDEVTESNAENLLPIPSECEVTLEDKKEFYDDDFEDVEYVEASLLDPEIVSVEEENVVRQEEEEERLINLMKNDISDSSNDSLLEEADLFLSDNSIPPGIENVADDPEGDIHFLEELLINDSILSHESSDSNFEDNPSISRPPPEPSDAETDAGEEILVVMIDKDKFDDDYHYFMFAKVFSLLSAESKDTIFEP
nr:putative ribonuclease H-like domain-containing protein [Tanacetum cinerariifolium]